MSDITDLLKRVAYGDGEERIRAHAQLWSLGGRAVDDLIAALSDSDPRVREIAACNLSAIGGSRAVEPLIALLDDEDGQVRITAADALGKIRDPSATEPLAVALRKGLGAAGPALGAFGGERSLAILTEALCHDNEDVRGGALSGLAAIQDEGVMELLISRLNDTSWYVRSMAADAIEQRCRVGKVDPPPVEPLKAAMQDECEHVRISATGALQWLGGPVAADILADAMRSDQSHRVRTWAALALGRTGDHRSVEPLLEMLETPDPLTRQGALSVLGTLKPDAARERVVRMLDDRDPLVRSVAVRELGGWHGSVGIDRLLALADDSDAGVRKAVLRAIQPTNDPHVTAALISALDDENNGVRALAARLLSQRQDDAASEVLMSRLNSGDKAVIRGAYAFFIRRGVCGNERLLIDCLNASGSVAMAGDFTNSGNPILETAGREWLTNHPVTEGMRGFLYDVE